MAVAAVASARRTRRIVGAITIVAIGRPVAIFINAVTAIGLGGWRRTTIRCAIALILARIADRVSANRRQATVDLAVEAVLAAFARSVTTA